MLVYYKFNIPPTILGNFFIFHFFLWLGLIEGLNWWGLILMAIIYGRKFFFSGQLIYYEKRWLYLNEMVKIEPLLIFSFVMLIVIKRKNNKLYYFIGKNQLSKTKYQNLLYLIKKESL